MVDHTNSTPGVCVIGRTTFHTGIGAFSLAACELFSRHLPTSIIPTDRDGFDRSPVVLPNGRTLPVPVDVREHRLFFYADVLVNGAADRNLALMPDHGMHIAHFCFDSDELPPEWVFALNERFHAAYVPSASQRSLAVESGVRIPVGVLPIALPLEPLLARPPDAPGGRIRFGTISAFHERKELETLCRAFLALCHDRDDVELVIHSNLSFGTVLPRLQRIVRDADAPRIVLSTGDLSTAERDDLLASMDVFVNCSRGEGYSIGAREALALGKVLVLSDLGVHRDLTPLPGVYLVAAETRVPARYPEIDNRCFGHQQRVSVDRLHEGLASAANLVASREHLPTLASRRRHAESFSMTRLSVEYASVIDPEAERSRLGTAARRSSLTWHPAEVRDGVEDQLGANGRRLEVRNKVVVPAHDGGFFSVFNVYLSHLVWLTQDDRCHMVLPDWDQARLVDPRGEAAGTLERNSFCYGTLRDGNIWTHLFAPPFGVSVAELNDADFLSTRAERPEAPFNERLEPMLTYYHAFDLYHSPGFQHFRNQYHDAYTRHVRLRPELQAVVDGFIDETVGPRRLLAAHVKHPSHIIEQPGAVLATESAYFAEVREYLAEHGIDVGSDEWRLVLGTDQDAVVAAFEAEFGDHVVTLPDVRRTTASEDQLYAAVAEDDPGALGFQVQNLVAANPEEWSLDMAREVVCDAHVMARAEVLFHVVSNVATAISFINPDLRMTFVSPESSWSS
ncbi:MAG: glycosyltransferase [Microthrixaceae bacterium]